MHKPEHITQGWQVLVRLFTDAPRRAPQWLLSAVAVALAVGMGIGSPFSASLLQAQDGGSGSGSPSGQQATAVYELVVDTRGLLLGKLCLRSTVSIPARVQRTIRVAADPLAGVMQVRNVDLSPEVQNPAIIREIANPAVTTTADLDVPLASAFAFESVSQGRTTIVFTATVQTSAGAYTLRRAVPVQVVPCAFRVDALSFWSTTMYNANVLISANIVNARMTSTTGRTFSFENNPGAPNFLLWDITTNRMRGCTAWRERDRLHQFAISGEIIDDQFSLTITYPEFRDELYCNSEITGSDSRQDCSGFTDGVCILEPHFYWATPDSLPITMPLDGGTTRVDHALPNSPQGRAEGRAIIKVTPLAQ